MMWEFIILIVVVSLVSFSLAALVLAGERIHRLVRDIAESKGGGGE